jgi:glycosyltransferase involved in cell wall biosynthesis
MNHIVLRLLKIKTIAVSEELSRLLSSQFKASIENVVPNGIDTSLFYPDPSPVLQTEKMRRKAILILSRSDARKGLEDARNVIKNLKDSCVIPIEIWTVGESAQGKFPGITHKDFGYVPEQTLRVLLSSADCFLYPSHSEGFGLMVIEAFACKCPVVTTKAVPYAVHGNNALVSKVGDIDAMANNVCRLLENPGSGQTITENGYTCALAYSLEHAKVTFESTLIKMFLEQQPC